MKVKNINGTSQNKCLCGSWLQHWMRFSGQKTEYCSVLACLNKDLVGAHVQKVNNIDTNWYIIPLCSRHNQANHELEVFDDCRLVSANKKITCEK